MSQASIVGDRTLVQIRERSFLDILDLALMVIRRRPISLGIATAVGVLPMLAINAWIFADPETPRILLVAVLFLQAPWATLPLTCVLGGTMFGQSPRPRSIAGRIVRGLPALVLVHGLLRACLGISGFLIPVLPARLWFASEVILLERAGPLHATRRCGRLAADRGGEFFLQWLAQLGFGLVFALFFRVGMGAIRSALFDRELTWEPPAESGFTEVGFQLGVWIAIAFFAVARFLNYIDQRIRLEGWELRLRLQAVGREIEKGMS